MESNSILEAFLQNKAADAIELSGGLVHQVYRVFEGGGTYIVKIRGDNAAQLDNIVIYPHEIGFEAIGIEIFSSIAPNSFPHLLAKDVEKGLIVLSDVLPSGGETLQNIIFNSGITANLPFELGELLGYVQASTPIIEQFREDDETFFNDILGFRFGRIPKDDLLQLLNDGTRGLVMGGLSPKNILIDSEGDIKICDLETACVGVHEFDIGYALGHLLLHTNGSKDIYDNFFSGFNKSSKLTLDYQLINQFIAATILYRTYKTNVPYKIKGNPDEISVLSEKAMAFLLQSGKSINTLLT